MKNYLKVDIANARLVMDRTFAKNCAIAGSAEYNLLQATRKDYPNFSVVQRTIKRNENKECYLAFLSLSSIMERKDLM